MPIKSKLKPRSKARKNTSELRKEILKLYVKGLPQDEICSELKGRMEARKLKTLVKENEFLSPKNFRLGALLLFLITAFAPPLTIYARGFEYRELLDDMIILSAIFSTPFLILWIVLERLHDLRQLNLLAQFLLGYLFVYIVVYINISFELKLWTLCIFPIILMPTFLQEYWKLRKFISHIRGSST